MGTTKSQPDTTYYQENSPNDNKLNYLIQIADILINNGGNRLEIRMRESRHDISLTNLGR